jgi:hypothetical protein
VASTLKVYMTMDPRSRRVAVQERRFGYDDFPPGPPRRGMAAARDGGAAADLDQDLEGYAAA